MSGLFSVKSANTLSALLGVGVHAVTIDSITAGQAAASEDYSDRTPQAEIVFKDAADKQLTLWANLKGYKRFDELTEEEVASGEYEARGLEGYAVNVKTGERVEDPARTEACINIIAKLGNDAGIPDGEDVTPDALMGAKVGIKVKKNEQDQLRFKYSMTHAQAVKEAEGDAIE